MLKKILFFGYLSTITIVSLLPSNDLPDVKLFPSADKVVHLCLYAGLTFLFFWSWPGKFKGKKQFLPLLLVFCWGFMMEILQGLGHYGRQFDLLDQVANVSGFLPGWLTWKLWNYRNTRILLHNVESKT